MYFRLMNQLDLSCMETSIRKAIWDSSASDAVLSRISHCITALDDAYGECRKAFDMGGFVFLLTDIRDAIQVRNKILDYYSISEKDCEYAKNICQINNCGTWCEELYTRSSDDAVVIIYSKETEGSANG